MLSKSSMPINLGDWVKGKTNQNEMIHGYIETIDFYERFVSVKVISCDNVEIIGKTVSLVNQTVEHVPTAEIDNIEQLYDLIDLALLTKDKAWFYELTRKLLILKPSYITSYKNWTFKGRSKGHRSRYG